MNVLNTILKQKQEELLKSAVKHLIDMFELDGVDIKFNGVEFIIEDIEESHLIQEMCDSKDEFEKKINESLCMYLENVEFVFEEI